MIYFYGLFLFKTCISCVLVAWPIETQKCSEDETQTRPLVFLTHALSISFFFSVRGLIFHIDGRRQPTWGVSSHSWSQRCRRTPAAGVIHNAGHCSEVTFITCCAMISFLNMRERAPQSHKYGNASNMIHLFPKSRTESNMADSCFPWKHWFDMAERRKAWWMDHA